MGDRLVRKGVVIGIIVLFIGISISSSISHIGQASFICKSNNPPYIPSNPIPDGAFDITICPPNLSWTGGDPDGDNVTYDVYFGKNDPLNMQLVAYNLTVPWYQIPFLLDFDTKYYWQVRAEDEYGLTSSGPIWSFKTEENLPPYAPSNPHPEDGANYVPDVNLSWEGSDPNECDILIYDLYFDDTVPPQQVFCNLTVNYWRPPYNLTGYKVYYWKVVAWDSGGLSNSSPIWTFSPGENLTPTDPIIDGPKVGKPGVNYEFTFVSIVPSNLDIKYYVKWGDGNEDQTGFNPSGEVVKLNHSWKKIGTCIIQAMAEDEFGYRSNWSDYLFRVPKSKVLTNSLFLKLLEKFPFLHKFIDFLERYN